jgi:uncharacterized oxidoreductase
MPLKDFLDETIIALGTEADEVLVERAKPLRNHAGQGEGAFVVRFNELLESGQAAS